MIKMHNVAAVLALSGLAVLPACSMFGGGDNNRQASRSSSATASAQPNYSATAAASTAQPQSTELTPDMTRRVQQTLQQDGTYHGAVDGVWGPATQAAVRSYQQKHNMSATGQLDQDTLASMNLAGSSQDNSQQQGSAQPSANQRYGSNYNPPPSNPNPPNNNPNPPNPTTTR